jgi:hypothetical protein
VVESVPGQLPVSLCGFSSASPGSDVCRAASAKVSNVVEFEGYVKRTILRYKSYIIEGKERLVPELLVYVNTHPDKPLRLDKHYLQDKTQQGRIPHPGQHVSAEAVEVDCIYILKHAAISIEDGDEYRRRIWVPAAILVKSELRDRLADMLLTVAIKTGKENGWKTCTKDIYFEAYPLVPGNPKTKMKKLGYATRFLFRWHMIKPLVYEKGTLPSRHFAKMQIWELEEKYRSVSLEDVLATRREFSVLEDKKDSRKVAEKSGGQVTLDAAEDGVSEEVDDDPVDLGATTLQ